MKPNTNSSDGKSLESVVVSDWLSLSVKLRTSLSFSIWFLFLQERERVAEIYNILDKFPDFRNNIDFRIESLKSKKILFKKK